MKLRPFWRYYGGKFRAAPRYPQPRHGTIVEPFAGSAGYAMRYHRLNVILVERYAIIAELWRYLIAVTPAEVRRIPDVERVDALPDWVPAGARSLVGFCLNDASATPHRSLSSGLRKLRANGRTLTGWYQERRELVAAQVGEIRHWRVIEGDYTAAPDVEATWFVDPPYANQAGTHYAHHDVDHPALGAWCRTRRGQVIACENEGATWLPFRPFATLKAGVNGDGSREVIWTNDERPGDYDAATPQAPLFPPESLPA
jgi:hypothetical protein